MKLAIVIGHTEKAKGACLCAPFGYVQEYEFSTVLAAMIQVLAKRRGVTCGAFFRDEVGIDGAYRRARDFDPLGIVELHFNAHSNYQAHGTETLYGDIIGSEDFAKCVQDTMCQFFHRKGSANRGVKKLQRSDAGYMNVNNLSGVPTILVEPFFGSSPEDAEFVLELMPDLADAILDGFLLWQVGDVNKHIATH